MKTYIHARDEESLKNGTYYVEFRAKFSGTIAVYSLGDFQRWSQTLPVGLREWPIKEARKVMKQ